jgi:hypothetical protein
MAHTRMHCPRFQLSSQATSNAELIQPSFAGPSQLCRHGRETALQIGCTLAVTLASHHQHSTTKIVLEQQQLAMLTANYRHYNDGYRRVSCPRMTISLSRLVYQSSSLPRLPVSVSSKHWFSVPWILDLGLKLLFDPR